MHVTNTRRKDAKGAKNTSKKSSFSPLPLSGKGLIAVILSLVTFLASPTSQATAIQDLQRFFNQVLRYSARFQQVVLDEAMQPIQESSGNLWIERPGKFRWDYSSPYTQNIVGDGKQVWVYDVDLKQVAVRRMEGALGTTPAILLAGRGSLESGFNIKDLGRQGEIDWVEMKPKRNDGGFETIRIGFEKGKIRIIEMIDGFGQTTRVTLSAAQENTAIAPEKFVFKPPAGVDVITE